MPPTPSKCLGNALGTGDTAPSKIKSPLSCVFRSGEEHRPRSDEDVHSENRKQVGAETERFDLDGQGGATPEEVGGSGDHRKWPCSLPLRLRSHVLCSQPFSDPTVNRDQDADRRAPGLEM